MYKISKSWLAIERKAIGQTEEKTLKISNEVAWDNDCNAENVASCFDFIRSCLNFQEVCEGITRTDSDEIKTEKHMIESSKTNKKEVIEKEIDEVQEIVKAKNETNNEVKEETKTNNNNTISSAFDW